MGAKGLPYVHMVVQSLRKLPVPDTVSMGSNGGCRYFLQAEAELGSEWTLMKMGTAGKDSLSYEQWLNSVLPPNSSVGVDPKLISAKLFRRIQTALRGAKHELRCVEPNLVDEVWKHMGQPLPSSSKIFLLGEQYTGCSIAAKIDLVRQRMNEYVFIFFKVAS